MLSDLPATRVRAAMLATYAAFIGSGFAFANWAARIPQVRDSLELSSAELGLVLLAIAAGSVVALPVAGPLVTRFGSGRTVAAMAVLMSAALALAAVGHLAGVVPLVAGLFLFGLGNGAWDVAMNVQGARVETELGRSIMSRFHAGWSLGTVAGALVGAGAVLLDVPVAVHLVVVAVLVGVAVPLAARRFLPDTGHAEHEERPAGGARAALAAWREGRTLLIGLCVLAFAFAEGAANDWISVALIDGYDAHAATGALGFAVFLSAMTLARWFGPALLDRYGRVPVVRAIAAVATVGLLLFVFAPGVPLALVGALLWGIGTSLGFPVGMSAAADDPVRAAARVSVVASIGYCAFLGGPPLIGFLGEGGTVLRALTVVAVLLGLSALVASALRPLPAADRPPEAPDHADQGPPGRQK
ncbi:MFS transporter [Geodermatophilus sp. SYSU D00691]